MEDVSRANGGASSSKSQATLSRPSLLERRSSAFTITDEGEKESEESAGVDLSDVEELARLRERDAAGSYHVNEQEASSNDELAQVHSPSDEMDFLDEDDDEEMLEVALRDARRRIERESDRVRAANLVRRVSLTPFATPSTHTIEVDTFREHGNSQRVEKGERRRIAAALGLDESDEKEREDEGEWEAMEVEEKIEQSERKKRTRGRVEEISLEDDISDNALSMWMVDGRDEEEGDNSGRHTKRRRVERTALRERQRSLQREVEERAEHKERSDEAPSMDQWFDLDEMPHLHVDQESYDPMTSPRETSAQQVIDLSTPERSSGPTRSSSSSTSRPSLFARHSGNRSFEQQHPIATTLPSMRTTLSWSRNSSNERRDGSRQTQRAEQESSSIWDRMRSTVNEFNPFVTRRETRERTEIDLDDSGSDDDDTQVALLPRARHRRQPAEARRVPRYYGDGRGSRNEIDIDAINQWEADVRDLLPPMNVRSAPANAPPTPPRDRAAPPAPPTHHMERFPPRHLRLPNPRNRPHTTPFDAPPRNSVAVPLHREWRDVPRRARDERDVAMHGLYRRTHFLAEAVDEDDAAVMLIDVDEPDDQALARRLQMQEYAIGQTLLHRDHGRVFDDYEAPYLHMFRHRGHRHPAHRHLHRQLVHLRDPLYALQFTDRDFTADDYEMLLQLDERIEEKRGLSKEDLAALVTEILDDREELSKEDEVRCSICLEDFVAGFALTRLPCAHRYHGECITQWLSSSTVCPICKSEVRKDKEKEKK